MRHARSGFGCVRALHRTIQAAAFAAIVGGAVTCSFLSRADTPPQARDVVVLIDGKRLEGEIVDMKREVFVSIRLVDGTVRTVAWGQVKNVTQGAVAQPASPPSASVSLPSPSASVSAAPTASAAPAQSTPSSPAAGCTKDTDCKGDRVCDQGECVEPPRPRAAPVPVHETLSTSDDDTQPPSVHDEAEPAPTHSHPNIALITTGTISLTLGYFIAALSAGVGAAISAGANSSDGASCAGVGGSALAFIPLFGPFLTLANYPDHQVATYKPGSSPGSPPEILDCNGMRPAVTALVWSDEILQLGGAGLITLGFVLRSPADSRSGQIFVSPGTTAGPVGMTLHGQF